MSGKNFPARFITFEGGEGAGKSTQITKLSNYLKIFGIDCIISREPGGSPGGEEIRKLLVEGEPSRWDPETETLLHFAARRDHLVRTIKPALEKGVWVLSDRYVDSTFAYQGHGHGISIGLLNNLHEFVNDKITPDLTFLLDLPVSTGLGRTRERESSLNLNNPENRYEKMNEDFHELVRGGYLEIAKANPSRCVVLDAVALPNRVFEEIKKIIKGRYLGGIFVDED